MDYDTRRTWLVLKKGGMCLQSLYMLVVFIKLTFSSVMNCSRVLHLVQLPRESSSPEVHLSHHSNSPKPRQSKFASSHTNCPCMLSSSYPASAVAHATPVARTMIRPEVAQLSQTARCDFFLSFFAKLVYISVSFFSERWGRF